jgi:hypothetical protein
MGSQTHRVSVLSAVVLTTTLLAVPARAVEFTLDSRVGDVYTYTLTYEPNNNYNQRGVTSTTITLSGLFGVTSAFGPTSTTYPNYVDDALKAVNLLWTPQVLNGGTKVVWTNDDPNSGTGNFSNDIHVLGFRIVAPNTAVGSVQVQTSGFAFDAEPPHNTDQDISKAVDGPAGHAERDPDPVPEPSTLVLSALGLSAAVLRRRRAR